MRPIIRNFASIETKDIRWLWPGVLALGKLSLIAGDPGLGKSFMTLDCAARLSRGGPWPCNAHHLHEPGATVLLSAEDDPNDTIKPRLQRAGADLSRVHILDGFRLEDGLYQDFDLSLHVSMLEQVVEETPGVRLVVIDPISAFTGAVDTHSNAAVRGMLKPLAEFASDYGVAAMCVTHLRKTSTGPMVHRAMGSLAFAAAARIAYAVSKDRNDAGARLFTPIKSNIAHDGTGFRYRIEDGACAWEDEPLPVSADDTLLAWREPASETQARWLEGVLRDGPAPVSRIQRLCEEQGRSFESIRRVAKPAIGAQSVRLNEGWAWRLPEQSQGGSQG